MIFVDLDNTLVKTINKELIPRNNLQDFIYGVEFYILSNSSYDHITEVINKFNIKPKDILSTYNLHTNFSINLDKRWVLVDDSPWEDCLLKFEKLGFPLRDISKDLDNFLEKHYRQVSFEEEVCLSQLQEYRCEELKI